MALNDTFVKTARWTAELGDKKYSDGGGLHLFVTETGKYWRYNYRFLKKQRTLALGVYPDTSLAQARKKHLRAREQLAAGNDPSEVKRQEKLVGEDAAANTFQTVAMAWHQMKSKSIAENTANKQLTQLETHIFPLIGRRPVAEVKPPEVLALLRKVAAAGSEYTATRLREICGQVFRYAIQTGIATYDPAASLRNAIAKPSVNHRAALTTKREFGQFVRDLRDTTRGEPLTKLCARFGLLTWTRPGELRQAKWEQIDCEGRNWQVPAIAMKTGKHLQSHTVPLSEQAMAVLPLLKEMTGHTASLFPGNGNANRTISENTINGLFNRMGYKDRQSHHGLRASARSLLSERGWSTEALERQLDHKEANKAVAAYARSQHLEERRRFMNDWGNLVAELESIADKPKPEK